MLSWTRNVRVDGELFPVPLSPQRAILLAACGTFLGAASFAAARGRAFAGAAFALVMSGTGWWASRWPQLSRALEINGAVFAGPFVAALLSTLFAATAAGLACAFLLEAGRPHALKAAVAVLLVWCVPTAATEAALARWWGLGPRSLSEAAGLSVDAPTVEMTAVRLPAAPGLPASKETLTMSRGGVVLSLENLARLESFLRRTEYRNVFAREALEDVRRGWLMRWDADRALAAMMTSVPGRAHPDYRGALDLIKVGPMTMKRFALLERLEACAAASPAGFESVAQSQYIFEGFAAAYARFGDEAKARRWLARIDNLMMVSDKKVEISPLEDFHECRVAGSVRAEGRLGSSVVVGLFELWKTTPTASPLRLLSGSVLPDARGEFSFSHLAPGEYEVSLLGRPEDLDGRVLSGGARFDLGYDHPSVRLAPIRIERFSALPSRALPRRLETARPEPAWRKR